MLIIGDLLVVASAFLAWSVIYLPERLALPTAYLLNATILPVFVLASANLKSFQLTPKLRPGIPVVPPVLALLVSISSLLLLVFLTKNKDISRLVMLLASITAFFALVLFRSIASNIVSRKMVNGQFATLCVYDNIPLRPREQANQIDAAEYGLSANASDPEMIRRLALLTKDFDRLLVHCPQEKRADWIFVMRSLSIPSEISVPELQHLAPLGLRQRETGLTAVIATGPLELHERILKRAFDLVAVICALPILLTLFAVIAVAIKLDSKGPVFFLQDRIGQDNRPFKIIKFRSMATQSSDLEGAVSTQRVDPRVTRVGNLLRRTSLDELPQLLNVLLGDMSIVGPRPHARLSRAGSRLFWEVDAAYWHRHSVKPGLTGLAQVRGLRGNTFVEQNLRDRLTADLEYVNNWSLTSDIRIILQTFKVLQHNNAF